MHDAREDAREDGGLMMRAVMSGGGNALGVWHWTAPHL